MYRCANDCFSYCKGKPDATIEEKDVNYRDTGGRITTVKTLITTCHKDAKTCPDRITQIELQALVSP